jgi:hypothetical protein
MIFPPNSARTIASRHPQPARTQRKAEMQNGCQFDSRSLSRALMSQLVKAAQTPQCVNNRVSSEDRLGEATAKMGVAE